MIAQRGPNYEVLQAVRARRFVLLITPDVSNEYDDVVQRDYLLARFPGLAAEQAAFRELVSEVAVSVTPTESVPVQVRDPKDVTVLAAALGGDADFLVTNDKDLLVLDGDPALGRLRIVDVGAFLAMLDGV